MMPPLVKAIPLEYSNWDCKYWPSGGVVVFDGGGGGIIEVARGFDT